MEIILLPYSKEYKTEVPYFIKEVKRLAIKYDNKIIESLDSISSVKINRLIGKTDVVIIILNNDTVGNADSKQLISFVNKSSKELLKVNNGNELGRTCKFLEHSSYYYNDWWGLIKKNVAENFTFIRHYA